VRSGWAQGAPDVPPLIAPLPLITPAQPPGGLGDGESALERFTRDVTADARRGRLDPLIGRDAELRRVTHILLRRTKNNPVLVGESGERRLRGGRAAAAWGRGAAPPLQRSR
jgi:type VI secretion system protein VasG